MKMRMITFTVDDWAEIQSQTLFQSNLIVLSTIRMIVSHKIKIGYENNFQTYRVRYIFLVLSTFSITTHNLLFREITTKKIGEFALCTNPPLAAMISGCLVVVPIFGSGMKLLVLFICTKFNGLIFNMEYVM